MANPRRRHHHKTTALRRFLPAIFATFFLCFVFLSFLVPIPRHHSSSRSTARHTTESVSGDASEAALFFVPVSGRKSKYDIWRSKDSEFFYGCSNASSKFPKADTITRPNRYLLIATSGGLNQQRTGIIDAVVAARILNATLVVPKLDQRSYWKDASNFDDIFDVNLFISTLSNDLCILKELPQNGPKVTTMRVPRKCNQRCYEKRVLPVIMKRHAVRLTKFDYRLANRLDTDLQKLRCRVNYHALKFTDPILEMGKLLVKRMRAKSEHFIALHLRYEPDMLAFSGCYYGGGDKERKELGTIRRRWKTLRVRKEVWPFAFISPQASKALCNLIIDLVSNPDKARRQGRCPLTPEEVGLMLRALGYGKDVHIYVASGEVYGGEETLGPLKSLFPNFHSKDTIATKEEIEQFAKYSSRMAALDFIVCDESDVFVTNNNGNMAKILAGQRRYFGHKPTIRPNAKKLNKLFVNKENITWEEFASKIHSYQRGFMGLPNEVRPGRGEFHENPSTCICENSNARFKILRKFGAGKEPTRKEGEDADDGDDDQEVIDPDFDGDSISLQERRPTNETTLDYDGISSDEPELEDILSD